MRFTSNARLWAPAAAAFVVLAGCGGNASSPATHKVSVRVTSPVASGETFGFTMGGQNVTLATTAVDTTFPAGVAEGDSYAVTQSAGPRTCTLSANRSGRMASADVQITADCGMPVVGSTSKMVLDFRGPRGTVMTVRFNGEEWALDMSGGQTNTNPYDAQRILLDTPVADGTAYDVAVATQPNGQRCSVYAAPSGHMPVAEGAVKVGCEYISDFVSRSSDGGVRATHVETFGASIGGNDATGEGRYLVFAADKAGLAGNTGSLRQIFWRDRFTGEVRLVSRGSDGLEGNQNSAAPVVSADGRTVVFESAASNLVAGDTNNTRDVFLWSADTNELRRLSTTPDGTEANGESYEPVVSGDGRVVAFSTSAPNLLEGASGVNVVRLDRTAGTLTVASRGSVGSGLGKPVGGSAPAISEDGRRIAFHSVSSQLTAGDANGLWDIFLYEHGGAVLRRVSLTADGGERNAGTESASRLAAPALSGDGRWLAYATTATNVVAGDTNQAQDVFLVDLDGAGGVRRVSVASNGDAANDDSLPGAGERLGLSYDGRWVAFRSLASNLGGPGNNVFLHDRVSGSTRALSTGTTGVGPAALSRRGHYALVLASTGQDPRYPGGGLFAHFTGVGRAWWWVD